MARRQGPQHINVGKIDGNFHIGDNYNIVGGQFNNGILSDDYDDSSSNDESDEEPQDDGRRDERQNDIRRPNRAEHDNQREEINPNREERNENIAHDSPPRNDIENVDPENGGQIDGALRNDDEAVGPENQRQIVDGENMAVALRNETDETAVVPLPVAHDDRIFIDGTIGTLSYRFTFPSTRSFVVAIPFVIGVGFLMKKWFKL